jgi:pyridoxine kinase
MALPVISATGVECSCIPTVLLSTHTGEFKDYTYKNLSDEMLPIAAHWRREGARFDGIYSGYLASPAQGKLLEAIIDLLAEDDTMIIVDPVMADNGEYYSNLGHDMCEEFRYLCTLADVITPNITEAAFLAGMKYMPSPHGRGYVEKLLDRLGRLGSRRVVITGVRPPEGGVGNLAFDRESGETFFAMRPASEGVFYGTGDLFASALAALLVRGAGLKEALETANALVDESIQRTELRGTPRRFGVSFEGALPAYVRRVQEIFGEN